MADETRNPDTPTTAIGLTVELQRVEDPLVDTHAPDSGIDIIEGVLDTDYPDPAGLLGLVREFAWLPPDDLAELDRVQLSSGEERVAGAAALATRIDATEHLVVPYGYPVYPMYLGEDVGCGFVQPAIGAVDLLSLCREP